MAKRIYTEEQKERKRARNKAWALANPEKLKASKKAWQLANREKDNIYLKSYRKLNPEKVKAWREANPEKEKARHKAYREANPEKHNFKEAKRRASKLQRTPKWFNELDRFVITEAFDLAKLRANSFGFKWHVDHIVPLQGKLVSGLHVASNIQVIPATVNLQKNNNYVVS